MQPILDVIIIVLCLLLFNWKLTSHQALVWNTIFLLYQCSNFKFESVNFARTVPNGLLVFFPSYPVMNKCLEHWQVKTFCTVKHLMWDFSWWKWVIRYCFSGRDLERGPDWSSINQFLLNQEAKETLLRLVSFNNIVSSLRAKV